MAIATATATFDGTQDSVAVVWPAPFANAPNVTFGVGVLDGSTVEVDVPLASITTTGCTVETFARFAGKAELIASD